VTINGVKAVRIIYGHSTSANGEPLALVILADRSYQYVAHDEF